MLCTGQIKLQFLNHTFYPAVRQRNVSNHNTILFFSNFKLSELTTWKQFQMCSTSITFFIFPNENYGTVVSQSVKVQPQGASSKERRPMRCCPAKAQVQKTGTHTLCRGYSTLGNPQRGKYTVRHFGKE